jgi:hypothetical protein
MDTPSPFAQGYRTFVMRVVGREPTVREIIDGMGPGVRIWSEEGIPAVAITTDGTGWLVRLTANIVGYEEPGVLVEATEVDLGEFDLRPTQPEVKMMAAHDTPQVLAIAESAEMSEDGSARIKGRTPDQIIYDDVPARRMAPEGVDPEDPSTWPEGYGVRWETTKATPEDQAAFDEGFREVAKGEVLGTIEIEALDDIIEGEMPENPKAGEW